MNSSASAVPLMEALPWWRASSSSSGCSSDDRENDNGSSSKDNQCWLVCDSVETDGRFLLYAMASDALQPQAQAHTSHFQIKGGGERQRVLWIACGPSTTRLVSAALKRMGGCEAAAAYLRRNRDNATMNDAYSDSSPFCQHDTTSEHPHDGSDDDNNGGPLVIRSVTAEMSELMLKAEGGSFDAEVYMKKLYRSIRSWMMHHQPQATASTTTTTNNDDVNSASDIGKGNVGNNKAKLLLVLDDVSALASLVGERLTYCFLLSVRALVKCTDNRNSSGGCCCKCTLVMRASQDYEMDAAKEQDTSSVRPGGSHNVDWVGAGGSGSRPAPPLLPWERSLPELADTIVNVEPLTSGYSREAHGRLVFVSNTCALDRQQSPATATAARNVAPESPVMVMNYCCQDTTVSAIRLRGPYDLSR